MSSEITKLADQKTAEEVIDSLSLEDLRYLNRLIVERINHLVRFERGMQLLKFSPGDRVRFMSSHGEEMEGTVMRVNQKTVSVSTGEADRWWRISPALLTRIE
jgi:hypothetical protein